MTAPKVDASYLAGLGKAKAHIKSIITKEHTVPSFLKLAIHDAFCYDSKSNVYGANASIRTQKELSHTGNEGLAQAASLLASVKAQVPQISFADLYQLAGITAIEVAGGPRIPFTPGRKDAWAFPPNSAYCSPNTASSPLEHFQQWVERTGLPQKLAVALLGVHPIARWWVDASINNPFPENSQQKATFSNAYFRLLLEGKVAQDAWLLEDTSIKEQVQAYAESAETFAKEYAKAHEQLSLLGTNLQPQPADLTAAAVSSVAAYFDSASEYALYAAAVVAAGGAVAYGIYRWRQRYLRYSRLLS